MMKDKYKTLIISCWVVLLVYFVIKLLGGNYFEAICYNPNIVSICEFVNTSWTRYLLMIPIYTFSSYLIYLTMTKQKLGNDKHIILILLPASIFKEYLLILGLIIDTIVWIIYPFYRLYKNKNNLKTCILRVLIGNILIIIFQIISSLTRNIGYYIPLNDVLIGLVMSIDYYLMIALYYLHTRNYYYKKEVK